VKYCSPINNYVNGNGENFEVVFGKFNVDNICTSFIRSSKKYNDDDDDYDDDDDNNNNNINNL
jgi:hypothetical protein